MTLSQRVTLWSTSGLVDNVVILPERKQSIPETHYKKIHRRLQPLIWVTNIENPAWKHVLKRNNPADLNYVPLTENAPGLHTSFLYKTRTMDTLETKIALIDYLLSIARKQYSYSRENHFTPFDRAQLLYEPLSRGL